MPGISDTAYPRLKPNPSANELDEVYTPNLFEGSWVEQRTREPVPSTQIGTKATKAAAANEIFIGCTSPRIVRQVKVLSGLLSIKSKSKQALLGLAKKAFFLQRL